MNIQRLAVLIAATLAAATPAICAGPCTDDVERMMDQINAKLAAVARTGPTVPQSSEARLHRQPTPGSIATAESRAGVLPAQSVEAVDAAMARARAADHDGDQGACERALAEVQRFIDSWPQ